MAENYESSPRAIPDEKSLAEAPDVGNTSNDSPKNPEKSVNDDSAAIEASSDPEKPEQDSKDSLPPVDRGIGAWLTVLGAFCGFFVSFGWITGEIIEYTCEQNLILLFKQWACFNKHTRPLFCPHSHPVQSPGSYPSRPS